MSKQEIKVEGDATKKTTKKSTTKKPTAKKTSKKKAEIVDDTEIIDAEVIEEKPAMKPRKVVSFGGSNAKTDDLTVINDATLVGDITLLTPTEKKKYLAVAKSIDTTDINSIQSYGSELNRVVQSNGDNLLSITRSNSANTDDAVNLVNKLLVEVNDCNIQEMNEETKFKAFIKQIPFVKKLVKTYEKNIIKCNTVAENVDNLSRKIVNTKLIAQRDNTTLQQIFENNVDYIKQLREYIIGAKLKMHELDDEIEKLQADTTVEPYQVQDAMDFKSHLQKRINDMEITQHVMKQDLLQIRALQNNNLSIAIKSDDIVNNVIPIWKNQLAIAVIMNNQKNNIKAEQLVSESTNKMLLQNAATLKSNTIAIAKESNKTVIDVETIKKTTSMLIETVEEYKRIQEQNQQNSKDIESTIKELGNRLNSMVTDVNP